MAKKNKKNANIFFIYNLVFFIGLTVATNYLVRYISKHELLPENPIFRIIFVHNSGAAFNILDSRISIIVAISIFALCYIFYKVFISKKALTKLGLLGFSMLSAGTIYNIFERLNFGYVVDYIDLKFINFAVFNMADVLITIGATIIIYQILVRKI